MAEMLAFIGRDRHDDEWCLLVHGRTRGEAKARFDRVEPSGWAVFTEIRLRRLPCLDDKPFTYDVCLEAGWMYEDIDTGEELRREDFYNECDCPVCRPGVEVEG